MTTTESVPADAHTAPAPTPTSIPASARLIDGANDIGAFVHADERRFELTGIHFSAECAEATNGRILIRVPYSPLSVAEFPPVPGATTTLADCIIPPDAVKEALAARPKRTTLPILATALICDGPPPSTRAASPRVLLAATNLDKTRAVTVMTMEGNYPDANQVIPADPPTFQIALSAIQLAKLAAYALKHGNEKADYAIQFGFRGCHDPVTFTIPLADPPRAASGVLLPARMA